MRLLLTAWAMEGRAVAFMDNLVGEVGDAELCGGITSTTRTDRILGGSKTYSGPFTTVIIGTSNNARLGADMPRRVIPIRLETDMANPERRQKFKHDLSTYPLARRPQLLADLFTMLRAWHLAGQPQADLPPLGKFEAWTRVVRQVCVFSGLADPYARTPAADSTRTRLVRTIAYGLKTMDADGRGLTAAAIAKRLTTPDLGIPEPIQDAADAAAEMLDRVTPVALGKILAQEKGRNLDGIKIVEAAARDHRANVAKWTTAPAATVEADDETHTVLPAATHQPPVLTPATPANESTHERDCAGDAGGSNGGSESPGRESTKRGGRVANNPHRGTVLDKGGAA